MLVAKLVLLGTLAILVSAAPQSVIVEQRRSSLRPSHTSLDGPAANDGICDICTNAIQSMEEYISDPQTEADMAKFLDEQICDALPDSISSTCKLEVPLLVNMVISMMKQSVPPATICSYMGLCGDSASAPSAPWAPLVKSALVAPPKPGVDGPFDCPMCKMVVQVAMQRISDPELRRTLELDISDACDTMPAESQVRCRADVTALFKVLDNLVNDVDPEGVCELALFCSRKSPLTPAPAALSELKAALARLLSTPRPGAGALGAGALGDACENCKAIISEVSAIVQDPTTQRQILDYAKEGCEVFQDLKPQCQTYVDVYGPIVLNMALQYLQPQPICSRMGYCPSAPPAGA